MYETEKNERPYGLTLDGKKLINVVQAALDNNMMADDLKAQLVKENPGHEVVFKVE